MDWLQVAILAIIQGLTEFLPISSSGHLLLPKAILGWPDQGLAFDVAVHVGSLTAVLLYFHRDVRQLIIAWCLSLKDRQPSADSRLAWGVIVATIPAAVIGLLADDFIEAHLRSIGVIATTTVIFGALLGWADSSGSRQKDLVDITLKLALIIGFAQALALIPGTSRSGITITAALMLGLHREAAARFSFLLSIPLILAAGGLKTLQLFNEATVVPWLHIIGGAVLSGLTAYLCIHVFLRVIERIGMMPFVIYRFVLGAFLLALMFL